MYFYLILFYSSNCTYYKSEEAILSLLHLRSILVTMLIYSMELTPKKYFSFLLLVGCFLGWSNSTVAQDAHFSQFYASPLVLNPALAGTAAGTYRVSVNYRDQWRGALDNPLRTLAASGDLNFNLGKDKNNPDIAGLGFLFYSDRVGDFDLNTNQVALIGSFLKSLDQRQKKYLGFGLQLGIGQKGINYEDLTFQDQFNAINGFTNATGEVLPQNNLAYADMAIGINYHAAFANKTKIYFGVGYAHFNTPNISFYASQPDNNPLLVKENILRSKFTIHLASSFRTQQRLDVQPRVLALIQGPDIEINAGTNFRFMLDDRGTKFFHVGPWIRGVQNIDGFGIESIVGSVGIELGGMLIGLSYDHNLSDLVSDRKGLNALEISITFIGEHENEDNFCPTF